MTRILYFAFFSVLTCCSSLLAQEWEQRENLPALGRNHPVTFALDGYGYVMTGGSDIGRLADVLRYDPSSDAWEELPDFPGGARSFAYGVEHNGKAYVGFGAQSSSSGFNGLNDLWEYDPETETWTQLADCLCTGRAHPAMVAVAGKIFVGMGNDDFGSAFDLNDWYEYDIASNTWSQKANLPGGRRHHPYYFGIGNKAYVGFGHSGQTIYKDMYAWDVDTEEWSRIADLPDQGRVAGTQFSYNGKGYLLSGQGENHRNLAFGEFWEYDPENDFWDLLDAHPGTGRWAPGSFLIDGMVYFFGGESTQNERDLWAYQLGEPSSTGTPDVVELSVSPNPARDHIMLDRFADVSNVELISTGGVSSVLSVSDAGRVDVSTLPAGQYVLRAVSADAVYQTKVMIVR